MGDGRIHTRFVAVAGALRGNGVIDRNLRKLRIVRWVDCVDVRACKTARPSILPAMSRLGVETGPGPRCPVPVPPLAREVTNTTQPQTRRPPYEKVAATVNQSITAMRHPESKSTQKNGAGLRQPIISSFFSQASMGAGASSEPLSSSSLPIDLTISDDDEQPAKKRKTTHGTTSDSTQRHNQSPRPSASRWRYVPSQSPEKTSVDPEAKKRRELFAKQLLADNSSFVDTTEPSDGHGLPSDRADGDPISSGVESDNEFKQLQEMFALKTEQKKKRKVTQERTSKKQAELGPSGEPYTALELQVWCFLTDSRTDFYNE
jgi:hypothetical protein